ncbi:MAG: hypothetical protein RJA07_1983 [Bacteroidota bacterium]
MSFVFCILSINSFAQFTDLYWNMGRKTAIDFRTFPPTINLNDSNKTCLLKNTSTAICDRNGNVIFYSNALKVYNRNGHIMPNGNNINAGAISNTYQSSNYYPPFKGAVSIPNSSDSNKIFMFYSNLEYTIGDYYPNKLYYLVIDRTLDGGLGDVVVKDQIAIQNDTLETSEVMAVQHGNGRDWWVLERNIWGDRYYTILLDSMGVVHAPVMQQLGQKFMNSFKNDGAPNISLNGDKVAYITYGHDTSNIELLNFDRCTGTFYNYQLLQWYQPGVHSSLMKSCCFSPNGRFLYICDLDSLWQLDLNASNILSSAVYLGYKNPFSSNFLMKNAPDGKIYIAHYGSWQNISVIEHPDVLGVGCNFLLDTIHFGSQLNGPWADGGLPNVPNLALGKLNCPTGIEEINQSGFSIYPNPAYNKLKIENTVYTSIAIYNVLGVLMLHQSIQQHQINEINVGEFSNGIYLIRATNNEGKAYNLKFVKE